MKNWIAHEGEIVCWLVGEIRRWGESGCPPPQDFFTDKLARFVAGQLAVLGCDNERLRTANADLAARLQHWHAIGRRAGETPKEADR